MRYINLGVFIFKIMKGVFFDFDMKTSGDKMIL